MFLNEDSVMHDASIDPDNICDVSLLEIERIGLSSMVVEVGDDSLEGNGYVFIIGLLGCKTEIALENFVTSMLQDEQLEVIFRIYRKC
jgi:hypothetical protein